MIGASEYVLAGATLASATAVWLVRADALRRAVLDVPNARSSHSRPTARGGGLGAIAVVLAGSMIVSRLSGVALGSAIWICLAAAAAVAAVGWIDDHGGLTVRARLGVHVLAGVAVGALSITAGFPAIYAVWWVFWAVSAINVVNFMDGIDGLIASQCAIAFGAMAVLGGAGTSRMLALLTAGACLGFLIWNWPPARIFLGDVGSGSFGFLLVVVGLLAMRDGRVDVVRVFLPLYALFLDATWTFVRRLRNGERVTEAHRSHLYQRLANGGWGHRSVTLLYAGAAVVGAAIALVPDDLWRAALILVYAVGVFALGAALDRTRPFVWRSAQPSSMMSRTTRDAKLATFKDDTRHG